MDPNPNTDTLGVSPPVRNLHTEVAQELTDGKASPRGRVKRVMDKTVDKLGLSIGEKPPKSPSQPTSGHRRIFSINRKSKGKSKTGDNIDGDRLNSIHNLAVIIKTPTLLRSFRCSFRVVHMHSNSFNLAPISIVRDSETQRGLTVYTT